MPFIAPMKWMNSQGWMGMEKRSGTGSRQIQFRCSVPLVMSRSRNWEHENEWKLQIQTWVWMQRKHTGPPSEYILGKQKAMSIGSFNCKWFFSPIQDYIKHIFQFCKSILTLDAEAFLSNKHALCQQMFYLPSSQAILKVDEMAGETK